MPRVTTRPASHPTPHTDDAPDAPAARAGDAPPTPAPDTTCTPTPRRRPSMTAADLVATGTVSAQQAYAATLVLARLHDRGVGRTMTLEDICEVLGYTGNSRRPASIPKDRIAPRGLRRGPKPTDLQPPPGAPPPDKT